ncbi:MULTISPECIES: hypothetical protein [Legionella]|uniref:Leucine-rich repeat-and coiled coil-containing protein n=1 Tax=Legionella drozanskii LLAP-1 TaxID=1212489 RepID=A0A0W0T8A3_9GAMM|nr:MULTISPECIES: hypothetical protein [Legionella]KTC91791.1 Leucine-rich repeat-and coiled coil-containing protein [Legionella drozanskii LLAP-1]PJE17994.1 MAG: hypothetical protein CK430_01115 [Legionella sp.]
MTIETKLIERIRANAPELKALDLSNQHLEYEELVALTNALKNNTNLRSLSLKGNQLDDRSIALLASSLPLTAITSLDLSNNCITLQGLAELAKHSKVETLNMRSNRIEQTKEGDISISSILDNPWIKRLDLSNNRLNELAGTDFFPKLKSNTSLQHLSLESTHLNDDSGHLIADFLQTNRSLVFLNISDNNLTDLSAVNIAYNLRKNSTLKQVWLKGNKITNETLAEFYFACEENKSLTLINLCHNAVSPSLAEFSVTPSPIQLLSKKRSRKQQPPTNHVKDLIAEINQLFQPTEKKGIFLLTLCRFLYCFQEERETAPILLMPAELKFQILNYLTEELFTPNQVEKIISYAADKSTIGKAKDSFFYAIDCRKSSKLLPEDSQLNTP